MNDAEVEPRLGSLFTGYGGLDLAAVDVYGARPVWHVENAPAPAAILAHHWPHVPNLGDVTAVDWDTVEPVDILTGGFPCQDVSHAAAESRAGLRPGTRSGLWEHMAYAIDHLRPPTVIIENVRGLLSATASSDMEPCPMCVGDGSTLPVLRALGAVLGTLAGLGYDASWYGLRAADVGAPHSRFRVFIVAHPHGSGRREHRRPVDVRPIHNAAERESVPIDRVTFGRYAEAVARWEAITGRQAPMPTHLGDDGRPRLSPWFVEWMMGLEPGHVTDPRIPITRPQRLMALGNGVVPQQAAAAIHHLESRV